MIPKSIRLHPVDTSTISHSWDDLACDEIEEPIDEPLYAALEGLSCRANVAFSAGMAAWVLHRLGPFLKLQSPEQYLECAWATLIDVRYCGLVWEDSIDDADWTGPIRGPVGRAMHHVMQAIADTLDADQPEIPAALSYNLAKHVLDDSPAFLTWAASLRSRLERYSRNDRAPRGAPIPCAVLEHAIEPATAPALIDGFLAGLNPQKNPFLSSPTKMKAEGFEGTPYRYI